MARKDEDAKHRWKKGDQSSKRAIKLILEQQKQETLKNAET